MKIISLGQADDVQPVITETVGEIWQGLKAQCETKLTKEQCDGLLGTQPIYFEPSCNKERWGIPFWAWIIGGYFLGKHI